ncbi:hypothetical protein [Holophaga foetida]|uniref:hypothetical protein n=1 Tax=Holophaga foetida TaxID=35839 RepID=UPI0002472AE1|nr:hypothetical protein [Holophaga foetida]
MSALLLSALLLLAPSQADPAPKAVEAAPKALSFASQRLDFKWDQLIPMNLEVDGLKLNSIFFNRKDFRLFKTVELSARAQIDVTNTASKGRRPGFAVAVFDKEDRLLGVASGGPLFGRLAAGDTNTYDLDFSRVLERLPNGAYFVLSVELSD